MEQTQAQQPQIQWQLSNDEANYILNVLSDRPFKEVNMIFNKLVMQCQPIPQEPPKPDKKAA